MDGERIERAIARIEAASRRIEAAAARPALSVSPDAQLQRKYEALRNEAGAALGELDRLIEGIEP